MGNLPPSADDYVAPSRKSEQKPIHYVGELVYAKTSAGPTVRVTVVEVFNGGFKGTVHPDDERRVYLAGVPECPPGFVSTFFDRCEKTRDEYEKEDWTKFTVRIEKKSKKNRKNGVPAKNGV